MPQLVTILGSTGSIGKSALRVIAEYNNDYRVYALACQRNIAELARQIPQFKPQAVAVTSKEAINTPEYKSLKEAYSDIVFYEGEDALCEMVQHPVDIVVSAIVGAAGLRPSLASLPYCKRMALANKETLVMAGEFFKARVAAAGVELIPVDSEHSAIFSLLDNRDRKEIDKLIITASGGSLRNFPISQLSEITPQEALAHPTWCMGAKITIDSATLMNKGLEVIEAHHLFDFSYDNIDVIIHPQSIVHSMIETCDGAIYAHMGVADMALPILQAFSYPERRVNSFGKLNLAKIGTLNFMEYDETRYPALQLCYQAGRSGGTYPAVLNAANEVCVNEFLCGKLNFTNIVTIVDKVLSEHITINEPDIEEIFAADTWARSRAKSFIKD